MIKVATSYTDKLYYRKYAYRISIPKYGVGDPHISNIVFDAVKQTKNKKAYIRKEAYFNIFTNDDDFIKKTMSLDRLGESSIYPINILVSVPKSNKIKEYLLNNKDVVITNETPDMEYRIRLKKKFNRENLCFWIENNPNLVHAPKTLMNDLKNKSSLYNRYIYIRDEQSLTLMSVISGDAVRVVERLVDEKTI